jgi:hypothetical protein
MRWSIQCWGGSAAMMAAIRPIVLSVPAPLGGPSSMRLRASGRLAASRFPDRGGPVVLQDVRRVAAAGQGGVAGVGAAGGQLPVGPLRCFPSGPVGVGGDEHSGPAGADVGQQLVGLLVGEGGA